MRALVMAAFMAVAGLGQADDAALSTGQTLYLPVYSHLLYGNKAAAGKPSVYPLSALVSLRNTDPRLPVRLLSARYYNTEGRLLREYLATPRTLPPYGTVELFVERNDLAGGSGANFIIVWQADKPVNALIAEAVHADVTGNRTLSFITSARPIK